MLDRLTIRSPKRSSRTLTGWEGFFPYYAGYPEDFARAILQSADLDRRSIIADPWNGSGTTTYAASTLGLNSQGSDINPAMVVIARARLLAPSEADSIEPIARDIVRYAKRTHTTIDLDDPLRIWFTESSAIYIRALEHGIRHRLLGTMTQTVAGTNINRISGIASTFYVSLFNTCRRFVSSFRSSNPTWLRKPKKNEALIEVSLQEISSSFLKNLVAMARALADRHDQHLHERGFAEIKLADTTQDRVATESVDFILTSPPYCTRIDYAAATRVELAVMAPLLRISQEEISRRMIGSTRVPKSQISISSTWGDRCQKFLEALRKHPSKASAGYYYKNHLDYFQKIDRSICNLSSTLKPDGVAVLVVQDSYYKDVHNDLPSIISDMCDAYGLKLKRKEDFHLRRSMSGINPRTRVYNRSCGAIESVLCLQKT